MYEIKQLFLIALIGIFLLYGCLGETTTETQNTITGEVVKGTSIAPEEEMTPETIGGAEVKKENETDVENVRALEKTEAISTINHNIHVTESGFDPNELTITKGENVTWKNDGYRAIIILIFKDDKPYAHQNSINPREMFTQEFNEIGTYDIYWNIFQGPIRGKITVQNEPLDAVYKSAEEPAKKVEQKNGEHYTEEQLIEDMTSLIGTYRYNISNFTRDPTYQDYIKSSGLKYHVIHVQNDKPMASFRDFCEIYCGENWDDMYYINKTEFEKYIPFLDKGNFSNEADYMRYEKDRILANHTRMEQVIELKNGKILEFRFFLVQTDKGNNFVSNLHSYQLIYKIPCSNNLTVFLRPKWQEYTVSTGAGGVSGVIRNWILEDERVREELLEYADKILDRCPIEQDFFENYGFNDYFSSELLAYYWKTHYLYQFNISKNLSIGVEKVYIDGDVYQLNEVNVSFTNNDYYALYDVGLKIMVRPDSERNERLYMEFENPVSKISPGQTYTRSIKKEKITFSNNVTVKAIISVNSGALDMMSIEETYTLEDLGLK